MKVEVVARGRVSEYRSLINESDLLQQTIETKIQQPFDCIRQQGDALNIQIDHKFEQLHQVLENKAHDIQQLKKKHQEDRTSIDQLLEVQNSAHLRLTKLEEAMEKSERRTRERNLKIFGIYKAGDGERTTDAEELVKTLNCFSVQGNWKLSDRVDAQNRADKRTLPTSHSTVPKCRPQADHTSGPRPSGKPPKKWDQSQY